MACRDFPCVAAIDAGGDQPQAMAPMAAIVLVTMSLVPAIIRQLKDGDDTAARILVFVYINLVLVALSFRRLDLSPPGSAAERRARIAICIHLLAVQVAASFMVDRLYEVILLWAVPVTAMGLNYKLGVFEEK